MIPTAIVAPLPMHGIGGAKDLPLPLELTVAGAVAALVVSFAVLGLAWRSSRYDGTERGRRVQVPAWLRAAARILARLLGLAVFGWALLAAVLGENLLINPFFGMFYVLLWVGVVGLSLVFGPFWKLVSPARTLNSIFAFLTRSDPERGLLDYPARLGHWPAALGLFAFVWLELVYASSTELAPVRLWFATYVAVMLIGGAVFGNRFLENADPFEVYSTLVGHLSPWGRAADGTPMVRSPLANLATVPPRPGLVAVVAVLFGSTAFDSFKESTVWVGFTQDHLAHAYLLDHVALIGFCVIVGVLFAAACMATPVDRVPRSELPRRFAHSIVPIIVGYIVAHYLTYFIVQGQQTLVQMSDPLSRGDNLLGTGDWAVWYGLNYQPTLLAAIKVAGVVLGHVVGVVAAHDRAISLLPRRHQLTGQLPLLLVMVAFTVGGLYLLFAA